jgi:hypothetical protein
MPDRAFVEWPPMDELKAMLEAGKSAADIGLSLGIHPHRVRNHFNRNGVSLMLCKKRNMYNKLPINAPKEARQIPATRETMEEYLARGGKVEVLPGFERTKEHRKAFEHLGKGY